MYTSEEMEIRLWDYIDGHCSGTEKLAVQELIVTDRGWQVRYEQLTRLHEELLQHQETEQPSMRFAKNVMENIAISAIARPAKAYVNKWVVRSIAAFFIIGLIVLVVTSISSLGPGIDFSGDTTLMPAFLKNVSFTQVFSSGTFLFSVAASTVAGLAFLDTYRTRMIKHKQFNQH